MRTIESLHDILWKRFVRMPYGHILDYADENGNAVIPTKEECEKGIPNVMSWNTSIANGAFFNGLYLYAQCKKYDKEPSEKLLSEIKIIANGLFNLCDVCPIDGFIARGVADDGVSHYPFSSEDQVGPFFLGLWRLYNSKACDAEMKKGIEARIKRTALGVKAHGYEVPSEWNVTRGTYAHADWRGSVKAMFTAMMISVFGGQPDEYKTMRDAHPDNGLYTRYEIASHGFSADMVRTTGLIQFWIDICAHLCLKELSIYDREYASYYEMGLKSNGVTATAFLADYKHYKNFEKRDAELNWRLMKLDLNFKTPEEAYAIASRQQSEWRQICSAKVPEHDIICNVLSGDWIAGTSGDKPAMEYAKKKLNDCIQHVNWDTTSYCYCFMAEAASIDIND